MSELKQELVSYWNERAGSYSRGVLGELAGPMCEAWESLLASGTSAAREQALQQGRRPRVLDLGCGPGMFSILFARMDCDVTGVDSSEEMLERARANAEEASCAEAATFVCSDVATLPFDNESFDVIALRNVTWLMRDPSRAYEEWLRVLVPGGKLLVFDANWYRYLIDERVAEQRRKDQEGKRLEGWDDDAQATSDEERRCEQLAYQLPLTYALRPAWDVATIRILGCENVNVDEDVWLKVWPASEQDYYGSTPMFLIEAVK